MPPGGPEVSWETCLAVAGAVVTITTGYAATRNPIWRPSDEEQDELTKAWGRVLFVYLGRIGVLGGAALITLAYAVPRVLALRLEQALRKARNAHPAQAQAEDVS